MQFKQIFDTLNEAIVIINPLDDIVYANPSFLRTLGLNEAEAIQKNIIYFYADSMMYDTSKEQAIQKGSHLNHEVFLRHKDGHILPAVQNFQILKNTEAEIEHYCVSLRNLSQFDKKHQKLESSHIQIKQSHNRLEKQINLRTQELNHAKAQRDLILKTINETLWSIHHESMQIQYASSSIETLFGRNESEFYANPKLWMDLIHPDDKTRVEEFFATLPEGSTKEIDFQIIRPDAQVRWIHSRIAHHPQTESFVGISHDITDTKASADMISFLAYHDPLTKLPNRIQLKESLNLLIERSKVISTRSALLFLDLDNFKMINDSKGHDIGDLILLSLAERIKASVTEEFIRFGGDEFVILMHDIDSKLQVQKLASKLLRLFKEAFVADGHEFFLSCSIGISLFPEHAGTGIDLIKHADTAMYEAKKSGKNQFKFYHSSMNDSIMEFIYYKNLIHEGLKNNNFSLYFQPLIHTQSGKIKGAEALTRFFHPHDGVIDPQKFICVAEESGDILELSRNTLKNACQLVKNYKKHHGHSINVSINLSSKQFNQDDLPSMIQAYVNEHKIDASDLTFEVTESVIMKDIDHTIKQLRQIKTLGSQIALDDFGTGYSSFSYLARLPIDILKIDKSFILGLFSEKHNQTIVESMITLAHAMGLKITAEGVETKEQLEFLQKLQCDTIQGFYFSEAISEEALLGFLPKAL